MKPWLASKGLVAGLVAFVACPCHLPLTLPIAAALMTGTVAGAWLVANTVIVYVFSTTLFLVGLLLVVKWLVLDAEKACPADAKQHRVLSVQGDPGEQI
jgi:hypothetical protein